MTMLGTGIPPVIGGPQPGTTSDWVAMVVVVAAVLLVFLMAWVWAARRHANEISEYPAPVERHKAA